ncbi:MAG TPA: DUF4349 domain-containing protein [Rhodocyclaceae bacterium]|nr:DUF4349 domain-containing protein [Rhodocyclaceae bacterium]
MPAAATQALRSGKAGRWLAPLLFSVLLFACSHKDEPSLAKPAPAAAGKAAFLERNVATEPADKPEAESQRFIAYRHYLTLEVPRAEVANAMQSAIARCKQLGHKACEIISSSLIAPGAGRTPRATVELRIVPEQFTAFKQAALDGASVTSDRTEAEDKTAAVIDVEARLKNKSELRDRLRQLLQAPGAKVKDLIEIEQQLANVQSELDSLAGQRKVLAQETEKTYLHLEFEARPELGNPGSFSPIERALGSLGSTFASSLAALITFIAAIVPWLVVSILPIWAIRRLWRRWRASRQTTKH